MSKIGQMRAIDCPYVRADPRADAYLDGYLDGWEKGRAEMRDKQVEEGRERLQSQGRYWCVLGMLLILFAGLSGSTGWITAGLLWLAFGVGSFAFSEADR